MRLSIRRHAVRCTAVCSVNRILTHARIMDVHVYLHDVEVVRLLKKILKKEDIIMATLQELGPILASISSEVDKVSADTDNLLAQLAAIPTGGLTPEQQAALDEAVTSATAIAARLQVIDDKVPDVIPNTPTA